jgi:type IX secretion system PorP/SprF family membrane protein
MKKKKIFSLMILLLEGISSWAQQDPMYNQYLFNSYTINAAESGARNYSTASILYRWQWIGMEGAPNTASVGLETIIGKGWGVGFNFIDDRIGPTTNQTINLSGAYHLNLSHELTMSVGLNFVGNMQKLNLANLQNISDPNDPLFSANFSSGFNPNAGGGILLYTERTFVGASLPRFVEYKITNSNTISLDQLRHVFIYGGHVFDISPQVQLKPSTLIKFVEGAPLQFDVNAVVSLSNIIDVGASYRSGDGMGLLLGMTIWDRFVLNYSYEIPFTKIRYASIQTHEVGIRYKFGQLQFKKIQSPRFFN